jgi:hypothetical protein
VIGYIEHARALSRDAHVELNVVDMLASDERVALIVREVFHRPTGDVEIRRSNVYRVRRGQIVEISIYEANQYEVDALVGNGPCQGRSKVGPFAPVEK